MSILFDENKKYQLMQLIRFYVTKTGELPDIEKLKSLGMTPKEIIHVLNIYPRGCKSLSQNTLNYLREVLKKLPELEILNMSGCFLTKDIIKELNKSNIKKVFFDATYFLNMFDFNFGELIRMSNKDIEFVNSPWFDFYYGFANALSGKNDRVFDYTNDGVKKYIKESFKKGYNPQSGLDGLINSYISGYRYGFQNFPHHRVVNHQNYYFKTLVELFLEQGAKLRLGQLVPSLDFFNVRKMNNLPIFIEDLSEKINMQSLILKTFYELDKSLIVKNINQYLPKNWDSIEALDWQENENMEEQKLEELIYQQYKFSLESNGIKITLN